MLRNLFLITAALLLLFVQSAFAQTEELPDTVWTKFTYPAAVNAVKFTPDGRYLASGGSDAIPKLWDVETGELIREFQGNGWAIWGLDVNPSGNLIAVVNSISVVTVWDINTGEILKVLDEYPNQMQGLEYNSLSFSNNGLYLAASIADYTNSGIKPAVFIWSTETWEVIGKAENLLNPFHVTFSPDDAILAVSNIVDGHERKTVGLYEVPSLNRIGGTEYISTTVNQSSFSPDGNYIAGALTVIPNKIWNTSDWKFSRELGKNSYSITFSNDNKFIITGGGQPTDRHVQIWNNENGELIYTYPKSNIPNSLDVSPNNKLIAASLMTSGIIVYYAKWNPTSVKENPVLVTEPLIFPNPASRTVNIEFELLIPSEISIGIYDINSRKISSIYDGFLEPGIQNFEWNISRVPSGSYFAHITKGGITFTVKIIVNK